jgi:CPA1 family monovalent cation:H+ antiporter
VTEAEIVLLLLAAIAGLTVVARRLAIPYPIVMTIGGLALSLAPNLPRVALPPEIVFLVFLPPVLFAAAYSMSPRELRLYARSIGLLAIGLVLATTLVVGFVVHALVPEIGWAAAFALGAIVSPPDAVAATSIARRLGLPRRAVAILEGESLVNDATALVALRLAIAAAATGTFSFAEAAGSFALVAAGGVAIGLNDPPVEVLVSLLGPFAAWIPAEALHVSGVLSVVTAGLLLGRAAPRVMSSDTRVLGSGVWQMTIFVVEGLVFVLIGLQLPAVIGSLRADRTPGELALLAVSVSLAVILARLAWVFPGTYLPRMLSSRIREREPRPSPRVVLVVAWAGMRGVVSLAAVLALPLTVEGGAPFPGRDLLVFLTFAVILATLVGQGLTLPLLIRRLGVGDDGSAQHEELHAREAAVAAALDRLATIGQEWRGHDELIDQMRARYDHAAEHLDHGHDAATHEVTHDQEWVEHAAIRQAVIDAQRVAVIDLRDRGVIGDEALRRVERDLDLEELRAES